MSTPIEPQIGREYRVNAVRKGTFNMRVTEKSGEWITGIITHGRASAMNPDNAREPFEIGKGYRGFITGEPEISLFLIHLHQCQDANAATLQGAFVPDERETDDEYRSEIEAKTEAQIFMNSWVRKHTKGWKEAV